MWFYPLHLQSVIKVSKKRPRADLPKRGSSAFVLFSKERRSAVVADHPDWDFGDYAKELSKQWAALPSTEKDVSCFVKKYCQSWLRPVYVSSFVTLWLQRYASLAQLDMARFQEEAASVSARPFMAQKVGYAQGHFHLWTWKWAEIGVCLLCFWSYDCFWSDRRTRLITPVYRHRRSRCLPSRNHRLLYFGAHVELWVDAPHA